MKKVAIGSLLGTATLLLTNPQSAFPAEIPDPGKAGAGFQPIQTVTIENRMFLVNDQPFFPIMSWLQDADNFDSVRACGMNTTAGYWPGSSGTKDVTEYLQMVREAGLYGVMPFDPRLKEHPALLGYIQDDEPDLPRQVSDAEVELGPGLKLNPSTPLWKLLDGVTHSWSVLDPLEGATVTIRLSQPVTVDSLAVWLTISSGLAVAKEMRFTGDGQVLLTAPLQAKKGRQVFDLPQPATFKTLTVVVTKVFPGDHVWGSISEIEGLNQDGRNVLLAPPRNVPRAFPEETLRKYEAIKKADSARPVFMTLTGYFHPIFNKWNETDMQRYPDYIQATDVAGFDIYPIYGWNKPEWIHLVQEATDRLVRMAGPRPVYAWIETSKGGQWTGPLERQKEVTPAHIRAEVWMTICRGATAIGYFTHVWKPSYHQFGMPEENRQALRQINDQITRLAPVILGADPKRKVVLEAADEVKVDLLAKERSGQLTLFAVNFDEDLKQTLATFRVDGLPAGREVRVVDENRTIRSEAGFFKDDFAPLAVHIYQVF